MFKTDKLKPAQLYYMMINVAIKSMDLVIIFSNVYTKKLNTIIKKCKNEGVPYLIVKE
jgi:ribosomal protein L7Ae-like RNA K-turn-binding protein